MDKQGRDKNNVSTSRMGSGRKGPLALVVLLCALILLLVVFFTGGKENPFAEPDAMPRQEGTAASGSSPKEQLESKETEPPAAGERIRLPPPDRAFPHLVRIHGQVLDPEGGAMPEVVVAFRKGAAATTLLAGAVQSGPDGRYAADLPPGIYTLLSRIPTSRRGHNLLFEPEEIVIPEAREYLRNISYTRPLCTISGIVTGANGTPIEEFGISLCTQNAKPLKRASSAADGRWKIPGVAPGRYRISIEKGRNAGGLLLPWMESNAPLSSPEHWPLLHVAPGESEIICDFTLASPVHVTATVSAAGIGQMSRIYLRKTPQKGPERLLGKRRVYSASIDEKGVCRFGGIYPGEYHATLLAPADGCARPDGISVFVDPLLPEQDLLFFFTACGGSCRLEGRIADQKGRGLGGARLALLDEGSAPGRAGDVRIFARAEALCDDKGRFLITGLRPGAYRLRRDRRIMKENQPILIDVAEAPLVRVGVGSTAATLTVCVFERTTVRGRVKGFENQFPLSVTASLRPAGGFGEYRTSCRPAGDGTFVLPNVPLTDTPVTFTVSIDLGGGALEICSSRDILLPALKGKAIILTR
jgi:hypothetical protein